MLALRAKTEAGWVLVCALYLSEFLFFRYLNVISAAKAVESAHVSCKFSANISTRLHWNLRKNGLDSLLFRYDTL